MLENWGIGGWGMGLGTLKQTPSFVVFQNQRGVTLRQTPSFGVLETQRGVTVRQTPSFDVLGLTYCTRSCFLYETRVEKAS